MPKATIVHGQLTRDLRRQILRPKELQDNLEAELPGDDIADQLIHFAVLEPDVAEEQRSDSDSTSALTCAARPRALSCCFLIQEECPWLKGVLPAYHLRQMATAPEARGRGYGSAVIEAVNAYCCQQGAKLVWCYAREVAVEFYIKLGFVKHGDVFVSPLHLNIPHQCMHLFLNPLDKPSEELVQHSTTIK